MPKPSLINIDTNQSPSVDTSFTPLKPAADSSFLGPEPVLPDNTTLQETPTTTNQPVNVATWSVMDRFDDGLRNALLNFIDTTKEGEKLAQSLKGRKKTLSFVFVGTATQSIAPGEIGTFDFSMSYPPGAGTTTSAPVATP